MKEGIQQFIRATPQQEGVWFYALKHSSSHWNFTNIRAYKGDLNYDFFLSSLQEVMKRHSSLNSNFRVLEGKLYQVINETVPFDKIFERVDLEDGEQEAFRKIRFAIDEMKRYEFNLEHEPLLRIKYFKTRELNIIVVAINHIITDGFSMQLFWKELIGFYSLLRKGVAIPSGNTVRQYSDFSEEQYRFMDTPAYQAQKNYWLNKMSGDFPVLNLPFYKDYSRTKVYHLETDLPGEFVGQLKSFALRNRVVYSAVFQVPYFLLLHKYSGQDRIVMSNMVHGRGAVRNKNHEVIGLFAKSLIQLLDLGQDMTMGELLGQVNKDLLESLNNGDIPYEDLMRERSVKVRSGASPLFTAVFNMMKRVDTGQEFEGLEVNSEFTYETIPKTDSRHDIYLYVIDRVKTVKLRLECRCEERLKPLVQLAMEAYLQLLGICIGQPETRLADIELAGSREQGLLKEFNNTFQPDAHDMAIHEAIRSQARKIPHLTALLAGQDSLTYQELDTQSDIIADELRKKGAGPGMLIGLLLRRSAMMIRCLLGILKSGAAYLPFDPAFPDGRLSEMIADANPYFILTEEGLQSKLPDTVRTINARDIFREGPDRQVMNRSGPGDTAYVIYTSGSTGAPKGVMITHQAVLNFIRGITAIVGFSGKSVFSLTTISFDIFVLETLVPLCAGGTIVLATEAEQQDPEWAAAAIIQHSVQLLPATPSRMKLLLNSGQRKAIAGLSDIILGGEDFPVHLLSEIKQVFKGRIFNIYGPTETTVYSSVKELTNESAVTIGRPIRNTDIYIRDAHQRICGIGIYGELCIAGDGLAAGYLGQPARTAEKFIPHPYLPGKTMYTTGDIGRWLPDGDLEITGRKDDQVKIRGYRVEPGEIEFHLKTHPAVKDAVIIAKMRYGNNEIHAYYTGEEAVPVNQLRQHLQDRLPVYMIPSYFIHRKEFPLTFNRKVDKKALREMEVALRPAQAADNEFVHDKLLSLWCDILQMENIPQASDLASNFFDLGGHSLNALHLLNQIGVIFNVRISMKEFFQYPTIGFLNNNILRHTDPAMLK